MRVLHKTEEERQRGRERDREKAVTVRLGIVKSFQRRRFHQCVIGILRGNAGITQDNEASPT